MNIDKEDQNYLKSLTILYVEDEEDVREQLCEFLSRCIGVLITAKNGAEGLEAFKKHSPDIVITDILMQDMDGLTMAEKMREIIPSVPIIVLTAFEKSDYLKKAINSGLNKYLTKPVNSILLLEHLLECVHKLSADKQLKQIMNNWPR